MAYKALNGEKDVQRRYAVPEEMYGGGQRE